MSMKEDTTKLSVQELAELYVNDPRVPLEHYRRILAALSDVFFSKRFPPSDGPRSACVFDPDAAARYCRNIQRFAAAIRIAYEQWSQLFWKIDQPGLGVLESIVKSSLDKRAEAESFEIRQVDMLDDKWDDMQANCDDFGDLVAAEMLRRRMNGESLTRRIPSAQPNAPGTVESCQPPRPKCVFKREGNTWTVQFFDEQCSGIGDAIPMRDIWYLLARPNETIEIHDLPDNKKTDNDTLKSDRSVAVATKGDAADLLKQITDAQGQIAAATKTQEFQLIDELNEEIDHLRKQYNENFDNRGRPRHMTSSMERDVEKTKKRVNRQIDKLETMADHKVPQLAVFLRKNLKIDESCIYLPPPEFPQWDT